MATKASPPPATPPPLSTSASTSTTTAPQPTASEPLLEDDFDTLLHLEDKFYTEGYAQGQADGAAAGRAEGRQLGLERGFQKFAEAGRLEGRAIVWANRIEVGRGRGSGVGVGGAGTGSKSVGGLGMEVEDVAQGGSAGESEIARQRVRTEGAAEEEEQTRALPPLPDNARLAKNVTTLYALVETESLSTDNTDEAVDDFDDRLRRAQGRLKVIERTVGEGGERQKGNGSDGHGHDPGAEASNGGRGADL